MKRGKGTNGECKAISFALQWGSQPRRRSEACLNPPEERLPSDSFFHSPFPLLHIPTTPPSCPGKD